MSNVRVGNETKIPDIFEKGNKKKSQKATFRLFSALKSIGPRTTEQRPYHLFSLLSNV